MNENKQSKLKIIWDFLEGSKLLFVISMLASLIITFINMVIPKLIGVTVDSVIGDEPITDGMMSWIVELMGGTKLLKSALYIPALAVAVMGLCMAIFKYVSLYFNNKGAETLMQTMRNRLYEKIQRLPYDWHMKNQTGDIIQRCTSDTETIRTFVAEQLTEVVKIIVIIIFSLIFLFSVSTPIALIALIAIPVIFGYSLIFYGKVSNNFTECDENEGVLSAIAQENLTGVRVVRAFGREKYEKDRFEKQNVIYTDKWMQLCKILAWFWGIGDFVSGFQIMLVVTVGTVLCVNGSLTAGGLIAAISYNSLLIWPVRNLGRILSEMSKAGVSVARIGYIMDSQDEEDSPKDVKPDMHGDIVFDNVTFSYDSMPVLKNVSFTVKGGTVLGVLGGTGSGKSTLTLLLSRLYKLKPENGKITVNGTDINDIKADYLRKNTGIVLQEPFLFSRTIAENIGVTADEINNEDIRAAGRAACLDECVTEFAKGYDTEVGERGVTLSGGQKQRAAIARVLMQKPPIMIFDDSLSAVDAETDEKIRESLQKNFGDSTVIIISHRITTLMKADNIIVLDKGKIIEQGNHEQLLGKKGLYSAVYAMQTGTEAE